jgi:hypothetical protein
MVSLFSFRDLLGAAGELNPPVQKVSPMLTPCTGGNADE